MNDSDRDVPQLLKELHQLPFDHANGNGIDFEPFDDFMSEEETDGWIRAWTGNKELSGRDYRIFGQDGTGGYVAIWRKRPDAGLLEQPIVFFGSEGELGVVAANFSEYLWLLAHGLGPYEAVACPSDERTPVTAFVDFARWHSRVDPIKPSSILERARNEFPSFEHDIRASCR
jgi:hypothetical protein